jgi:hypothetical protein
LIDCNPEAPRENLAINGFQVIVAVLIALALYGYFSGAWWRY